MNYVVDVDANYFMTVFVRETRINAGIRFILAPTVGKQVFSEFLIPKACGLFCAVKAFFEFADKRFACICLLFVPMCHLNI